MLDTGHYPVIYYLKQAKNPVETVYLPLQASLCASERWAKTKNAKGNITENCGSVGFWKLTYKAKGRSCTHLQETETNSVATAF